MLIENKGAKVFYMMARVQVFAFTFVPAICNPLLHSKDGDENLHSVLKTSRPHKISIFFPRPPTLSQRTNGQADSAGQQKEASLQSYETYERGKITNIDLKHHHDELKLMLEIQFLRCRCVDFVEAGSGKCLDECDTNYVFMVEGNQVGRVCSGELYKCRAFCVSPEVQFESAQGRNFP